MDTATDLDRSLPLDRPIRVVMFGGGPGMERGAQLFLAGLEEQADIQFIGAFCQSPGQSVSDIIRDLWQRRGLLAIPILFVQLLNTLTRYILHPRETFSLKQQMGKLSTRIHVVLDIHEPLVIEQVRTMKPDLGLIYGSPILIPKLFEIPTFGTLGIHHGKVPEYRGKKTTFWAMYNGESCAGVTIQKVNAGLDTGQIVKQGGVRIGKRTRTTVWHNLENLGVELYIQAILEVKNGMAKYRPQVGIKSNLYSDPSLHELLVFWHRQILRIVGL